MWKEVFVMKMNLKVVFIDCGSSKRNQFQQFNNFDFMTPKLPPISQ